MKGARRFLTFTRLDLTQGMGSFATLSVPIASITSIEAYSITSPYSVWNEVRSKVNLGKNGFYYTQESMEELLARIETPATE